MPHKSYRKQHDYLYCSPITLTQNPFLLICSLPCSHLLNDIAHDLQTAQTNTGGQGQWTTCPRGSQYAVKEYLFVSAHVFSLLERHKLFKKLAQSPKRFLSLYNFLI